MLQDCFDEQSAGEIYGVPGWDWLGANTEQLFYPNWGGIRVRVGQG